MEIKIIENRDNLLFRRKEVKLEVDTDVTPSREDAKKMISEKIKCPVDCVHILKIEGKFGESLFTISAEVYNNERDKKEYAPVFKKKDVEAEKRIVESKKVNEKPKEESEENSSEVENE
ncbi:MAG: hypothetical protein WC812_01520 [Candidatus Pacearchaeota archaeon]|jgi:ribosomal protein S24E